MNQQTSRKILEGVRVLDLSRILAAPWATQMLGDFGADVIKVERPGGGDEARMYGPAFLRDTQGAKTRESGFYLCGNRNKRSITIDLSVPAGQELVRELARKSDVVVENYKVGTLARYGLDYESLARVNPGLVYCSLTGYGQDGPYKERPGYDAIFQAQGGLMAATGIAEGRPGAGPMKVGPSLVDVMTGYNAAIGILGALRHRDATGEGQHIDVALLDTVIAAMSHYTAQYLTDGTVPPRRGDEGNGGGPSQIADCLDGALYFTCGNDGHFRRLCEVLGLQHLPAEPRFANMGLRAQNRVELRALLEAEFPKWRRDDLLQKLVDNDVPCGAVNELPEVFADPQVQHRGVAVTMPHPLAGTVKLAANPIRLSKTPVSYDRPPPTMGQHTDEVLREVLGLDDDRIRQLAADKVV